MRFVCQSHSCWLKVLVCLVMCLSVTAGRAVEQPSLELAGAEPRVEAIPRKAPNQPYTVRGQRYEPMAEDVPFKQRGLSSWYGDPFHGRKTASGETFDKYAFTAAHPTLPIPSYVRVRHVKSDKEVIVRINDRGPFHGARILDLSLAAAQALGVTNQGTAEVEIERLTFDDIRTGRWRQTDEPVLAEGTPEADRVQGDAIGAMIDMTVVPEEGGADPSVVDAANQAPMAVASSAVPEVGAETLPDTEQALHSVTAAGPTRIPYWVQLGAFGQEGGAERFRKRIRSELQEMGGMLATFQSGTLTHLQLGPFAGPIEAGQVAQRVRTLLHLVPVIVQRP